MTTASQWKKVDGPQSAQLRKQMDSLALQRDHRIELIKRLRAHKSSGKFTEQAYQLLTGLFWSRANCSQRSHLLKTADWLIDLQGRNSAHSGTLRSSP